MNFLNEKKRKSIGSESAYGSNSGVTRQSAFSERFQGVPSQPLRMASPRGMLSLDSCLQPDTRNFYGTSGNVFEDPPAPHEPTAARFGNARSLADTHCELVSLNTGRLAARTDELERNTQNFAPPTPRFARKFSTWNPPFHAEGVYAQKMYG